MPAWVLIQSDPIFYTYPRLYFYCRTADLLPIPLDERWKSHLYNPVSGSIVDLCDAPRDPADPPIKVWAPFYWG